MMPRFGFLATFVFYVKFSVFFLVAATFTNDGIGFEYCRVIYRSYLVVSN